MTPDPDSSAASSRIVRAGRETHSFLDDLIASADDAVIVLDPHRRIVAWNPSAERIFRRREDEALGRALAELLPGPVAAQLDSEGWNGDRESRTPLLRMEGPDGNDLELVVTRSSIPWGGQAEPGRLLLVKDVTEQRRRWEEQLARSEKLSALGQLATGMAHDFNNILQSILGHAQIIGSQPGRPETVRKSLTIIEQAITDGIETVARIRRYARREAEREPEDIDLAEVVREVVEMTRPRWKLCGPTGDPIVMDLDLHPLPPVLARESELREVFTNLLLNAVDAMPQGGRLSIRTRSEPPWAVVTVSDTGIGISPEHRRRIFEPFFTTKAAGTGLGLSIVSGIVAGYGGTIDVKSAEGEGTTFAIRLPLAPARGKGGGSLREPRASRPGGR